MHTIINSLMPLAQSSNEDAIATIFMLPCMCGFQSIFWLLWVGIMFLSIAGTIFWIMMIIDVTKRDFPNENDKTMWILIIVLTGAIGALIYWLMVKKKK